MRIARRTRNTTDDHCKRRVSNVQTSSGVVSVRLPREPGTGSQSLHVLSHEMEVHGPTPMQPYSDREQHLRTFETPPVFIPLFKLFQMSVPSSPTHFATQDGHAVLLSPLPRTRTVAIVKNHALRHRLDIEPRIFEAGFEVRETQVHLFSIGALNSSLIDCERKTDGV